MEWCENFKATTSFRLLLASNNDDNGERYLIFSIMYALVGSQTKLDKQI